MKKLLAFFQLCSQRKDDGLGETLVDTTAHKYHALNHLPSKSILRVAGYRLPIKMEQIHD